MLCVVFAASNMNINQKTLLFINMDVYSWCRFYILNNQLLASLNGLNAWSRYVYRCLHHFKKVSHLLLLFRNNMQSMKCRQQLKMSIALYNNERYLT